MWSSASAQGCGAMSSSADRSYNLSSTWRAHRQTTASQALGHGPSQVAAIAATGTRSGGWRPPSRSSSHSRHEARHGRLPSGAGSRPCPTCGGGEIPTARSREKRLSSLMAWNSGAGTKGGGSTNPRWSAAATCSSSVNGQAQSGPLLTEVEATSTSTGRACLHSDLHSLLLPECP
jgi:hypothetical protein